MYVHIYVIYMLYIYIHTLRKPTLLYVTDVNIKKSHFFSCISKKLSILFFQKPSKTDDIPLLVTKFKY